MNIRRLPARWALAGLAVALAAALLMGVAVGSVAIPADQLAAILAHRLWPGDTAAVVPVREAIVWNVRVPRVALAAVVGAGLSVCGMALQAVVRNPLADPMLLGVSSGAALGAVLVLVVGVGAAAQSVALPVAAFAGALCALIVVFVLSRVDGRITTVRLILAGVAVAEVLSALTSLLIVTSGDPHRTESALRWMLGGLGGATWSTVPVPAAVVALGTAALFGVSRPLNLLHAGEESATALGLDVHRFRGAVFVVVALIVGVLVSVSGTIGFVGLILPHAVRLLVGPDHRCALPAAALLGATFLVGCDVLARTVAAPEEIPVGILTALAGGPFFLWLMHRRSAR